MTLATAALLLVVGVVAGSVAASLGVGGGIVYVPVLVAIFGFTQHSAEGTSLAVIVPSALIAAKVHSSAGRVDWPTVALLSVGAIVGGFLGARAALALDAATLQRLFGVLVAITALRMLRKTRASAHESGGAG
jgi:uncharacterized membrane protein YfcA